MTEVIASLELTGWSQSNQRNLNGTGAKWYMWKKIKSIRDLL